MTTEEPLKLIEKCHAPECGMLYALNQDISDEDFEKIKPYMQKYSPASFEDVMKISGNPNGWMCTLENASKVEEILGITETLEKIAADMQVQKEEFDRQRVQKEEAQLELEKIFFEAKRPKQKLSNILKAAQTVYDPINSLLRASVIVVALLDRFFLSAFITSSIDGKNTTHAINPARSDDNKNLTISLNISFLSFLVYFINNKYIKYITLNIHTIYPI